MNDDEEYIKIYMDLSQTFFATKETKLTLTPSLRLIIGVHA